MEASGVTTCPKWLHKLLILLIIRIVFSSSSALFFRWKGLSLKKSLHIASTIFFKENTTLFNYINICLFFLAELSLSCGTQGLPLCHVRSFVEGHRLSSHGMDSRARGLQQLLCGSLLTLGRVGSWFLSEESNPHPLHCKMDFNHWTAREVPLMHWHRLGTFTPGGQGSVPGQRTKTPQATWCGQKKKDECGLPLFSHE